KTISHTPLRITHDVHHTALLTRSTRAIGERALEQWFFRDATSPLSLYDKTGIHQFHGERLGNGNKNGAENMGLNAHLVVKEDVLIVRLSGELDHHESERLHHEWKEKMYRTGVKHCILNLESVTFMDSSGLGVVLGRYKEVLQLGGEMVVCS